MFMQMSNKLGSEKIRYVRKCLPILDNHYSLKKKFGISYSLVKF